MTYNGNENYIFVSYAHNDSSRVLPIIDALSKNGYRVWYDSGIEAGTEWPEYIESRLMDATAVLVFMTPSAVESRNCRNEINFALELKKEVLVIYLEETSLLKGMRLQLNSTQSLFRSHHKSDETLVDELLKSRLIQNCREDNCEQTAQTPPPVTQTQVPKNQIDLPDKKKNKWALYGIIGAVLAAIAIIILICVLVLGSDDDVTPAETDDKTTQSGTAAVPEDDVTENDVTEAPAVMSDDLFDFTVEIEGVVFSLPCKYDEFASEGWTISSTGYSDVMELAGGGYETISMSKNGKRIKIMSFNPSGNAMAIKDSLIGGISFYLDDGVDVKLAKGITINSTVEQIMEAYGSPNTTNEYENRTTLTYTGNDPYSIVVSFTCYTDPSDREYSEITIKNLVNKYNIKTETNTAKPEYLSQYKQPSALGTDLKSSVLKLDGELYAIPAPVSAFTDNGWKVTEKPSFVKAGNTETIRIEKNGESLYVSIANASKYQTIPENCVLYSLSVYSTDNIDCEFPGGITFNSTKETVESIVADEFDYYNGTYSHVWSYYDYDKYNIAVKVSVSKESGTVDMMSLSYQSWDY